MKFDCHSLLFGVLLLLLGTCSTDFGAYAIVQVSPDTPNLYFVQPGEDAQDVEALFTRPPVAVSVDDVGRPVPSRFVFLLDDLPDDYQATAAQYPQLHFLSRLASEFRHETSLAFVVVPRSNTKFLSLLNFQLDLLPLPIEQPGNGDGDLGIAMQDEHFLHVSRAAPSLILLYDFDAQRAYEFQGLISTTATDSVNNRDEMAVMAAAHRFVGKALSGDWPTLIVLPRSLNDPATVNSKYQTFSPPLRQISTVEQLCGETGQVVLTARLAFFTPQYIVVATFRSCILSRIVSVMCTCFLY